MIELGFEGEFLYPKYQEPFNISAPVQRRLAHDYGNKTNYACPFAPGYAVTAWWNLDHEIIVVRVIQHHSLPLRDAVFSELSMQTYYVDNELHLCALINHFITTGDYVLPLEVTT